MGVAKAPEPLTDSHLLVEFDCGNEALNDWFKKHALKNQDSGASRTFLISKGKRVVGFYALVCGSVGCISAPAAIARNMPEAVPVMVLDCIAVERAMQGQGLVADEYRQQLEQAAWTCYVEPSAFFVCCQTAT